jgi:hypothetical protein
VVVTLLTGSVQLAGVRPAAADASGAASCIGIEASSISPPGSSDEFPDGLRGVLREVRTAAEAFGINQGAIFSSVAKLHAGSHKACDEAG